MRFTPRGLRLGAPAPVQSVADLLHNCTMNLVQELKSVRKDVLRSMQLRYAAFATWIPATYPDFMCIGAPRAATTWLYKNLQRDPQVYLPKAKEVHFFDEKRDALPDDRSGLRWHRTFYFDMSNPAHFRWYSLQFRAGKDRKKGDITPVYSMLSPERVRLIAERIPGLKVIYIMRNPIDRAWSGLRKSVWYQKGSRQRLTGDRAWLLDTIMHPEVLERGNYRKAIETWGTVIPERDMLYLFYDDIAHDPRSALAEVYAFLGLEWPRTGQPFVDEKRVNAAPVLDMPDEVRAALAQHYESQIRYLQSRFNRDLRHWSRAEANQSA